MIGFESDTINDHLSKKLAALGLAMEKRIGKKAARAASTKYAQKVRKKLPTSGEDDLVLKKAVRVAAPKGRKYKNSIAMKVGIGGDKAQERKYAHVFEFGRNNGNRGTYEGREVFTDTLQEFENEALEIMRSKIAQEIKKHG